MDMLAKKLKEMFLEANDRFLKTDKGLFKSGVSERTLCGALMIQLYEVKKNTEFEDYYVDVEYNRNLKDKKTYRQSDKDGNSEYVTINCDLIFHSRGENLQQDNLITLEMKKTDGSKTDKDSDRRRLMALTSDNCDEKGLYDRITLPKYVCGYKLGIYYEIKRKFILLEYYYKGSLVETDKIPLKK